MDHSSNETNNHNSNGNKLNESNNRSRDGRRKSNHNSYKSKQSTAYKSHKKDYSKNYRGSCDDGNVCNKRYNDNRHRKRNSVNERDTANVMEKNKVDDTGISKSSPNVTNDNDTIREKNIVQQSELTPSQTQTSTNEKSCRLEENSNDNRLVKEERQNNNKSSGVSRKNRNNNANKNKGNKDGVAKTKNQSNIKDNDKNQISDTVKDVLGETLGKGKSDNKDINETITKASKEFALKDNDKTQVNKTIKKSKVESTGKSKTNKNDNQKKNNRNKKRFDDTTSHVKDTTSEGTDDNKRQSMITTPQISSKNDDNGNGNNSSKNQGQKDNSKGNDKALSSDTIDNTRVEQTVKYKSNKNDKQKNKKYKKYDKKKFGETKSPEQDENKEESQSKPITSQCQTTSHVNENTKSVGKSKNNQNFKTRKKCENDIITETKNDSSLDNEDKSLRDYIDKIQIAPTVVSKSNENENDTKKEKGNSNQGTDSDTKNAKKITDDKLQDIKTSQSKDESTSLSMLTPSQAITTLNANAKPFNFNFESNHLEENRNATNIVDEEQERINRQLFIGNIPPYILGEPLQHYLNGVMRRRQLCTPSESPFIKCYTKNGYAFAECMSVEHMTKALKLNGIPFRGYSLRVSRYSRPSNPEENRYSHEDKVNRRLFVGNIPPNISCLFLTRVLNDGMREVKLCEPQESPIMTCYMNYSFAFAECTTVENANKALNLSGIPCKGYSLNIRRPFRYNGPHVSGVKTWQQLKGQDAQRPKEEKAKSDNYNNRKHFVNNRNSTSNSQGHSYNDDNKANERRNKKDKKYNQKKKAWLKYLPEGSMDPISLEPLDTMLYPPFALKISEPYDPVPEWPTKEDMNSETPIHHLFDGRVLAYYLVSQLQFIDPLNRRDLTRPEIENLDEYLRRHRLGKAGVEEAYDNNGITISAAGQLGQTAAGRNAILQQEARNILNAIFVDNGARGDGTWGNSENNRRNQNTDRQQSWNNSQRRYWTGERNEANDNEEQDSSTVDNNATGVASHEGGMLFIDDDVNPAYRGGIQSTANGGWSSVVSHEQRINADNFPSLQAPATETTQTENNETKKDSKASGSLLKISNVIKKSNPASIAKQKAAREEFQQRAALANIPYNPFTATNTIHIEESEASLEAKVNRNKQLAEALGIQPSSIRINKGWARPTDDDDIYRRELQTTNYTTAFVSFLKDNPNVTMTTIVKVEKKLKSFLLDDTSASYSFSPMKKAMRKFVHEYCADYWKLETQSYDLEPRRYVHVRKLRDTRMPNPLMSDVLPSYNKDIKNKNVVPEILNEEEVATANNRFADFLKANESTKPDILLYNNPIGLQAPQPYTKDKMELPQPSSNRAMGIGCNEQRIKLNLAPRTKPIETLPAQPKKEEHYEYSKESVEKERNEAKKKKLRKERQKQRALQRAFESDSDSFHSLESAESSEWEEMTPEYCSADEV